ncbi:MAG: hypothetical protein AB7G88_07080, partial [Thermomicrobiales bacterium]
METDFVLSPPELRPTIRQAEVEYETTDNLDDLLSVLPPAITEQIRAVALDNSSESIVEIVLDQGRLPEIRIAKTEMPLGMLDVTRDDLLYVAERIGNFGDDNRAGIERTLHRISAIRNR